MTTTHTLAEPGKYLTFALAREEYGLPVLKVREIIKMMDITLAPQVPRHVKVLLDLDQILGADTTFAAAS